MEKLVRIIAFGIQVVITTAITFGSGALVFWIVGLGRPHGDWFWVVMSTVPALVGGGGLVVCATLPVGHISERITGMIAVAAGMAGMWGGGYWSIARFHPELVTVALQATTNALVAGVLVGSGWVAFRPRIEALAARFRSPR